MCPQRLITQYCLRDIVIALPLHATAFVIAKHSVSVQLCTARGSKRNTEMLLKALTTSAWKGNARDKRKDYLDLHVPENCNEKQNLRCS